MTYLPIDKHCAGCGEMMRSVKPQRVYCDRCLATPRKRRPGTTHKPAAPAHMSLAEISIRAKAAGMSYGAYIASLRDAPPAVSDSDTIGTGR